MQDHPRSRLSDSDYQDLRQVLDGDESFMSGMQVVAPRFTQVQHRKEEDTAPFLYNDTGTREFLLKHFPLLGSDQFERSQAHVWAVVIYHYFRLGEADRFIEQEMNWESGQVSSIVQQIRRVIKGLRRNGKPYSKRPRGRPRKAKTEPAKVEKINESTRDTPYERVALPSRDSNPISYPTGVPAEPN
jgi:hypothetical protein